MNFKYPRIRPDIRRPGLSVGTSVISLPNSNPNMADYYTYGSVSNFWSLRRCCELRLFISLIDGRTV